MKMHRYLQHFRESIIRIGHDKHGHSGVFESVHKVPKALFAATNMRPDGTGQHTEALVNAQRRYDLAMRSDALDLEEAGEEDKKCYFTAYQQAANISQSM